MGITKRLVFPINSTPYYVERLLTFQDPGNCCYINLNDKRIIYVINHRLCFRETYEDFLKTFEYKKQFEELLNE